ncbi:DUF308 domain-containing protein [Comamonas sp. NyZ500]|uniref:HdeD family acid-resistance protein n=1 Tax=Comamonas sp. NyZ500 TaxID=2795732 RepID=UPI00192B2A0C|nr:DUF308 domain-containing protein [Comamonas sp. NyZ500]MBL5976324.1 DUF308 domain-containing protein [Comamonas sp. NyZ500]
MIRLAILLLGKDFLHSQSSLIRKTAYILISIGVLLLVDAFDGALFFPLKAFAYILLIEGLASFATVSVGQGGQRRLRVFRGIFSIIAAVLIIAGHHGNMMLSLIMAIVLMLDGIIQCFAAYLIRYRGWGMVFFSASAEVLVAIFLIQPWPTHYAGTVPYFLSIIFHSVGIRLLLAARDIEMSKHSSLPVGQKISGDKFSPTQIVLSEDYAESNASKDCDHALVVHVWTPVGSAKSDTRPYPIIDRYIAAIDKNGNISTGHAALESPEGVYISLYPTIEIDRTPGQFGRILRATSENDVPGIFQKDYVSEAAAWCGANNHIRIRNYDPCKLKVFWEEYRLNTTYNLTSRNCSSSVAQALEAALDGALGRLYGNRISWKHAVKIFFTPEFWVAVQLRKRAMTMAWTPGIVLDYARALSMVADPQPFGLRMILSRIFAYRA